MIFKQTIGPICLILGCPTIIFLICYTNIFLDGSVVQLGELMADQGLGPILKSCLPYVLGSKTAWTIVGVFACTQLFLMRILPGRKFIGPVTPTGHYPVYKANGLLAYATTLFLFCISSFYYQIFSPTIVYDHFPEILGALNLFSLFFCLFLQFKGYFFPSTNDRGGSGNFIFDYYWGTELYPRILGWDVKLFTNSRFGMMSWALIIISFAAKQQQVYGLSDSMIVAVVLQLLYITKFFIWETGYLCTLDIIHDRAGYYICWGCLVWVPGFYTSATLYLVNHPNQLGLFLSLLIGTLGGICILVNYLADRQRQKVRLTNGNCTVWGSKPLVTVANYTTSNGEAKQNLLLASGWWGISRHFHYIPEKLGAFLWTVPALFTHVMPYFYVIFLTILLINRAFRDDQRCSDKYGKDWSTYCELVPYKIIPNVL